MASTILPNVTHALITGGQFTSIIDQRTITVNQRDDRKGTSKGVDLLCEYCALGALLDSNERFDPPRCTADTRKAIIAEIFAWIYGGGDAASMAWLFGGAGAGKSALAQTIAEICRKEGRLAASFFFSRTSTAERSDGSRLIPTLVFQLLETFPDLRVYVEEAIEKHVGMFSRAPRTHMDLLFVKPLISLRRHTSPSSITPTPSASAILLTPTPTLPASTAKTKSRQRGFVAKVMNKFATKVGTETPPPPPSSDIAANTNAVTADQAAISDELRLPRFIVIDGLDECNSQEIQVELLRILAGAIPLLPFPLRFLIASRPEGHIMRTIDYDESFEGVDVRKFDLGNDGNADSDIGRFLIRGFQEIRRSHPLRLLLGPSWPSEDAIKILVGKSSSHFIYAATSIKYIQYPRGRPDARLDIVLGLSSPPNADKPFAQLDALYTHIFMSMEEDDRATVKLAFGIIAFAGLPRFLPVRTSPAKLEEYLGMQPGEIDILLEPILSLVVLPENREDNITILHASLLDFLLDDSRSGGLRIDLETATDIISDYLLKEISMCSLDSDLLEGEVYQPKKAIIHPIINLLSHCKTGRISNNLRNYFVTFPMLYDVVLHPKFILKYLTEAKAEAFFWLADMLGMFFALFEKFDNTQYWRNEHSTRIERQLVSFLEGLGHGPYLLDEAVQEPPSNDIVIQNYHRVYKALANVMVEIHGLEGSFKFGVLFGEKMGFSALNLGEPIPLHVLLVFLPHMTHKDVKTCTMYSKREGFTLGEEYEVHQVVQQRVKEYLQRINNVAESSDIQECRKGWKLIGNSLLV